MPDQQIEQEIQDKGLTAPRITPDDVEANIVTAIYFTGAEAYAGQLARRIESGHRMMETIEEVTENLNGPLSLITFCILVLRNGFTVIGESACASPENFDAEIGRKIARQNAVQKIWPLMGYELRSRLAAKAEG